MLAGDLSQPATAAHAPALATAAVPRSTSALADPGRAAAHAARAVARLFSAAAPCAADPAIATGTPLDSETVTAAAGPGVRLFGRVPVCHRRELRRWRAELAVCHVQLWAGLHRLRAARALPATAAAPAAAPKPSDPPHSTGVAPLPPPSPCGASPQASQPSPAAARRSAATRDAAIAHTAPSRPLAPTLAHAVATAARTATRAFPPAALAAPLPRSGSSPPASPQSASPHAAACAAAAHAATAHATTSFAAPTPTAVAPNAPPPLAASLALPSRPAKLHTLCHFRDLRQLELVQCAERCPASHQSVCFQPVSHPSLRLLLLLYYTALWGLSMRPCTLPYALLLS